MSPVLLVVGVCNALVHIFHGHHGLELAQLRRTHLVNLLQADEGEFGERELIILGDVIIIRFYIKIPLQRFGQQVVEPSRLIGSLRTDEDQDFMIHHLVVE